MLSRNNNREGQKLRSKSNQRRKLKSPIKIKEKIKQLQGKLEKEALFRRQKPHPLPIPIHHTPRQEDHSPLHNATKRYQVHSNERPRTDSLFAHAHIPMTSKRTSDKDDRQGAFPKVPRLGRTTSVRSLRGGVVSLKEDEGLQRLKEENQRYKQIYSKSQQKMQELEYLLHEIKGRHESEKYTLQKTIDGLQKRIDEKRINLGHLYAYDEKGNNFLLVQDRIIAETDNENSSSPGPGSKHNSKPTPHSSNLSLQSK